MQSRGLEGHREEFGNGLSLLEPIGQDSEREGLNASDGVGLSLSVRQHAWQGGNFSQPAAVRLLLDYDLKDHGVGTLPEEVRNLAAEHGDWHSRTRQ